MKWWFIREPSEKHEAYFSDALIKRWRLVQTLDLGLRNDEVLYTTCWPQTSHYLAIGFFTVIQLKTHVLCVSFELDNVDSDEKSKLDTDLERF